MAEIDMREILRHFGVLFNRIAMYPPQHPSFQKTIEEFYRYLKQVSTAVSSLEIYATPVSVIINGKELKQERGFALGQYLHRRRIESLRIDLKNITRKEVEILALALSNAPREVLAKGGVKKELEAKGVRNAEVKELDYQRYLAAEGEAIEAFWDFFSAQIKNGAWDKIGGEEAAYMMQQKSFLEEKLSRLEIHPLLSLLDKFKKYLQQKHPDQAAAFLRIGLKAFLKKRFDADKVLEWEKAAGILQEIEKEGWEDVFFDFISADKESNLDILKKIAFLTGRGSGLKLSGAKDKLAKLDRSQVKALREAARQLMREPDADKFISASYRRFLSEISSSLSQRHTAEPVYSIKAEEIESDYLYMLADILSLEQRLERSLADEMKKEFAAALQRKDTESLLGFWEILKANRHKTQEDRQNVFVSICAALQGQENDLLDWAATGEKAEAAAKEIFRNIPGGAERLWSGLQHKPQKIYDSLYKKFLALSPPALISRHLQQIFRRRMNALLAKECLDFLSQLPLDKNKDILLWIAATFRGFEVVLAQALRILADKALPDAAFFKQFIKDKRAAVREAALRGMLAADRKEAARCLRALILPFNIFGLRNNFVKENIDIVERNKISLAEPVLRELAQRASLFSWFEGELKERARRALREIRQRS